MTSMTFFRNPFPFIKVPLSIAMAATLFAFAGGLLSLIGWFTETPSLVDWWDTGIRIKANTAILIIATAVSLFTLIYSDRIARYIGRSLGLFVSVLGGLTLVEHITGLNFGIDTLLFDEPPGALATAAPGRMGPPASLSFVLLGMAIFFRASSPARPHISIWLAVIVLGIGTLSLVGYLYGAEAMYTIPRLTGIAVQSAIMLVALAIGLMATCTQHEPVKTLYEDSSVGLVARRILLVAFVVPVVIGWLRIQGFRAGLYDNAFGTALRSIVEIVVLVSMLWWSVQAIRHREIKQRRAEAQQESSEQRLVQTLESMPDGFITINQAGRLNYVNAAAAQIFGRRQEELIGAIWWKIFPAIRDTALFVELQRAARDRISTEVESPDFIAGGNRHFCYRIHPDNNHGLSVYLQDVTDRKVAQDALHEADRRKDEFIAVLAHELRNPLAPIRTSAALLNSGNVPAQILHTSAQIIERQVKHMARLLEDLLDISRISQNRLEIRREIIELKQVIESAVETSRPAIQKANHQLQIDLPSTPIFVEADAIRLAQVFSNLLNNAAQYTPGDGNIKLAIEYDADTVTVHIEDNGIGIEQASLPYVFAMFSQVTPMSSGTKSGLGIGLSLASKIVELHGGKIEVSSPGPQKGSTFGVHLPRVQQNITVVPEASETNSVIAGNWRILVVDDLKDNVDSLAILLKNSGHEVAVAYGGRAAIEIAESFQPEILLLDIGMPEVDGIEVCRTIRQRPWGKQMKIVALTGWGQPNDISRTQEAGFTAHLVKPINFKYLMDLLSSYERMPKTLASTD